MGRPSAKHRDRRTMTHHLEVLGGMLGGRLGIVEGLGKANLLNQRLGHPEVDGSMPRASRNMNRIFGAPSFAQLGLATPAPRPRPFAR
jgi:hypothetical protein